MMNISQVKIYLIDYIFIFFTGNNCITMSGGFRMACLEKFILETALAAINKMRAGLPERGAGGGEV